MRTRESIASMEAEEHFVEAMCNLVDLFGNLQRMSLARQRIEPQVPCFDLLLLEARGASLPARVKQRMMETKKAVAVNNGPKCAA